jgi:hypothetical protein
MYPDMIKMFRNPCVDAIRKALLIRPILLKDFKSTWFGSDFYSALIQKDPECIPFIKN